MHIAQEIIKNIDTRTPDDVITLDYEGRFLRRKRLMTDSGEAFLVELPETISLSATDGFVLEDGRIIAIQPKPEPLLALPASSHKEKDIAIPSQLFQCL